MKNINRKLLWPLLAIESESGGCDAMRDHVGGILATLPGVEWDVDGEGNVITRKGKGPFPVCVVAHMDTVHRITGHGIKVVECNGMVTGLDPITMEQTGIGGDDKCGIYAALVLLSELENCRIILTVDEEIGAIGASRLDLGVLSDVGFMLQADRRGASDMVTRACGDVLASPKFAKAAGRIGKRFGYRKCDNGSLTDVQELVSRGAGVCALNLSAGYHRPHQDSEYIDLSQLGNCVGFMLALARAMAGKRWEHVNPPKPKYSPKVYKGAAYASYASSAAEAARLGKYWEDMSRGAYPTQAERIAAIAKARALDVQAGAMGMPDWEPSAGRGDPWDDEAVQEWETDSMNSPF